MGGGGGRGQSSSQTLTPPVQPFLLGPTAARARVKVHATGSILIELSLDSQPLGQSPGPLAGTWGLGPLRPYSPPLGRLGCQVLLE